MIRVAPGPALQPVRGGPPFRRDPRGSAVRTESTPSHREAVSRERATRVSSSCSHSASPSPRSKGSRADARGWRTSREPPYENPPRHPRDHARRRRARRLAPGDLSRPARASRDAPRAPPRSPEDGALRRAARSTWRSPIAASRRSKRSASWRASGPSSFRWPGGCSTTRRAAAASIPYGNKPHEVIYSVSRGGLEHAPAGCRGSDRPGLDPLRTRRCPASISRNRRVAAAGEHPTTSSSERTEAPRRFARRSWKRTGGRLDEAAARPRLQGALDSCGGGRRIPDGEERPAHLAAGRIHADRAAQRRRQLHRDAVPAEPGRRELRGPDDARGRARAFRTPVRRRDSAHARASSRTSSQTPRDISRRSAASPGRSRTTRSSSATRRTRSFPSTGRA